ncbi:hypothetical protein B9Z55_005576 [Caenorhabditis nigoni]|uniref:Uncharacterized protein n=1 Tax=Caenorhabditis nigoni TaxID=1611254 RepID=A0A2G5V1I4_9PELO|nr:hypothetical protein B9Z55_005576 [Caenorhabditis nigoni]
MNRKQSDGSYCYSSPKVELSSVGILILTNEKSTSAPQKNLIRNKVPLFSTSNDARDEQFNKARYPGNCSQRENYFFAHQHMSLTLNPVGHLTNNKNRYTTVKHESSPAFYSRTRNRKRENLENVHNRT